MKYKLVGFFNYKLQITNYKLQIMNYELWIMNYVLLDLRNSKEKPISLWALRVYLEKRMFKIF